MPAFRHRGFRASSTWELFMNRRETILKTAVGLFPTQRFDATTTLQLARKARVTEPLIYYQFSGSLAEFSESQRLLISTQTKRSIHNSKSAGLRSHNVNSSCIKVPYSRQKSKRNLTNFSVIGGRVKKSASVCAGLRLI